MTAGIIAVTSIPGWPSPPDGIFQAVNNALAAAGFAPGSVGKEGFVVGNVPIAQNALSSYPGSATELQWNKDRKQAQLDANLETNFNLIAFIRNGSLTPVTGTQVGNFLAGECSNYRTLRAQIAAATTVAQVNAIDINSGWPNNP